MADVGLMFVGAVLFINGLLLLGVIDGKGAGVFNLFVGALQCAGPFFLIATAKTASDTLLDAGIFLFGFTYLYVGICSLKEYSFVGLGWYSMWVAVMACAFGLVEILRFKETTLGILWLHWSVLWGLFWVVLALGATALTKVTGWATLVMSWTTCTIPGFLLLLGDWGKVSNAVYYIVSAVTLVVLLSIAATTVPKERDRILAEQEAVPAADLGVNVGV